MLPTRRSIATATLAFTLSLVSVSGPFAADKADEAGKNNETKVDSIRIVEPWARASAGMAMVGAAYLTLENTGATADRLVEAASPVATKTELHTHIVEGDIMRMRAIESIDLPPGEIVNLRPGGLHVMLIGLAAPLQMGEHFPLTLTFAEGGTTTVEVEVLQPGAVEPRGGHAGDSGDENGHGHHGHDQGQVPADEDRKPAEEPRP